MPELKFDDLLKKYNALLAENGWLRDENKRLKEQLGLIEPGPDDFLELRLSEAPSEINQSSNSQDKIALFMLLFKGREDVYAKRWQNKEGKSGYSPVCLNEWKPRICNKPRIKCSECTNKAYRAVDEKAIEEHLRGTITIGIYPMLPDETTYFLAIDFDEEGWRKDISTVREVCKEFDMPIAIERSRSGNGAHMWFFFETPISATLARRFGSALLTYSMSKRHEIKFRSYDRLFPNQDTLPKGGLGNLIALPLQKEARKKGNSVFIDEQFQAYEDQWRFLSKVKKLSEETVQALVGELCKGNELGSLRAEGEEGVKPWEHQAIRLSRFDFPLKVEMIKTDMLYIEKRGISQKALNMIKRLATFKNPEFYKAQAMRMPTYNKPRVISCADEMDEYLCIPRGCEEDLKSILEEFKVGVNLTDKTNHERSIQVRVQRRTSRRAKKRR